MLYKLAKLKIPWYILSLIENFLSNRTFTVKVENTSSKTRNISNGTPQGSVLSPTLFLVFINDIPIRHKKNKEYTFLFADDLSYTTFYTKKNKSVIKRVNCYLKSLENWSKKWRLAFAPSKCNYIIFTRDKRRCFTDYFDIKLNDTNLERANVVKFLGVKLDQYLSFNQHFDKIRESCIDRLKILKVLCHSQWRLNQDTRINLYNSLVQSLIDYSAFALKKLSETRKKSLQSIQNNALRVILKKRKEDGNSILLELSGLTPIESRLKELVDKYLKNAFLTQNPMIIELIDDFQTLKRGKKNPETILCNTWASEISN